MKSLSCIALLALALPWLACQPGTGEEEPDSGLDAGPAVDGGSDAAFIPDAAGLSPGQSLPDQVTLLALNQCRWIRLLDDVVVAAVSETPDSLAAVARDGAALVCALAEGPGQATVYGQLSLASVDTDTVLSPTPFAASVFEVSYGDGAGFGQDEMPEVVLGPPEGVGEGAGSLDVVSLGFDGTIILELGLDLVDGPGPDLLVFENPFNAWLEPGQVSVSADGVVFNDFSCAEEEPYAGCAGLGSVLAGSANGVDPLDPEVAGGDAYDLTAIGVSRARYVKVRSLRGEDLGGTSAGFDLDAVAAVHTAPRGQASLRAPADLQLQVGVCAALRADLIGAEESYLGVRSQCSVEPAGVVELAPDCQSLCGAAVGQASVQLQLGDLGASVAVTVGEA